MLRKKPEKTMQGKSGVDLDELPRRLARRDPALLKRAVSARTAEVEERVSELANPMV
jgi:hypothetical protein